ncbi:low molecular weight protein-tyrosine-phosphatase [Branchiibius sp. NY16-3462-2]|uniref:low molecular weight protein-tyrosine-phosphatase n=1 Tax=Branchiibius sp. NY16-3462-2 TaxID=1807500 RepID=UPI0007919F2C|nr:low molecular weight protein-tyrosine-phosphatase [Branchiibius sp. NY16-3462-2]KYH44504.1 protein tyrosine phosphatase [Branchiibius sp. NY16-3462-2]
MPDPLRIVFVCTGNICRSPIAEKVLQRHLQDAGLADAATVTSAGTGPWHEGEPADSRAVDVLTAAGYSASHVAHQITDSDLSADLLVALDSGHARDLRRLGAPADRVHLLRSFDPDADGAEVPDPYYDGPAEFQDVLTMVESATSGVVQWVRDQSR